MARTGMYSTSRPVSTHAQALMGMMVGEVWLHRHWTGTVTAYRITEDGTAQMETKHNTWITIPAKDIPDEPAWYLA